MGGGKKNENENGRKREFATDPRSKRAREKNTPFGHAPHSDHWIGGACGPSQTREDCMIIGFPAPCAILRAG